MATKWKYADIDAENRLDMLRNGNKELFLEEAARTKEVAEARRALGLDTTEQEKWMDTVGYNYNLSLAPEGDKVSKTGYADLYLNGKKQDTEPSKVKLRKSGVYTESPVVSHSKSVLNKGEEREKQTLERKYQELMEKAKQDLYNQYTFLDEAILNSGGNINGGKLARAYEDVEQRLNEIYNELSKELSLKLSTVQDKYDDMRAGIVNSDKSKGTRSDVLVTARPDTSVADKQEDDSRTLMPSDKGVSDGEKTESSKEEAGEVTEIQNPYIQAAQEKLKELLQDLEKRTDAVKTQTGQMSAGGNLAQKTVSEIASLIIKLLTGAYPNKLRG